MPEIVVYAVAGRTPAQKKGLMKAITDAVAEHFAVDPQGVVVQIVESDPDSKSKGGIPYRER
ncbi:MAG: 4-oxalocrotonate tautomerase [Rhodanobacter sp.]|nr:MAG: 4-oxalocrotonate tautomerase [Rhodanobacter sp.]